MTLEEITMKPYYQYFHCAEIDMPFIGHIEGSLNQVLLRESLGRALTLIKARG